MYDDDRDDESFEERLRSIARDVSRSLERVTQVDLGEVMGAIGVDPVRATELADDAVEWLRTQAAGRADDLAFRAADRTGTAADEGPPARVGPNPLDLPTGRQGTALAALDSGRWTVEPGSQVLVGHGQGAEPTDALGLVGELRARDWITTDGQVTLVGRAALGRWLDAADPR